MSVTERIGAQFRNPTGLGGTLSTFLMNKMNRRQYSERELSLPDGAHVLDVGFGNGFMLQRLAGRHKCDYYGIEISADIVSAANKRNARTIADGRVNLALGDVIKRNFTNSFFGKVYNINTIYCWDDKIIFRNYFTMFNSSLIPSMAYNGRWGYADGSNMLAV